MLVSCTKNFSDVVHQKYVSQVSKKVIFLV